MGTLARPFFPIIYVRGYAMTAAEIVETTSTPFMGFEAGSTKVRQTHDGKIRKFVFESPLVRLMKDYGYKDIYASGDEAFAGISPRSIVIHRYYDPADPAFGDGNTPTIEDAAKSLGERIIKVREAICGDSATARRDFRVYLVAHSMGGLVCRCLLQNSRVATADVRKAVDKVFTYATPHNGIDMGGFNVPSFLSLNDLNNFSRKQMAKYLKVPADEVNTLGDSGFPPERLFSLIGTNSRDYTVAHGLSAKGAGEMSDGLVRIANAYVKGSPRAFVNRSHSGFFGIVNSEEGYQNLVRFLFGDICATGSLEIERIPFPPDVQKACDKGVKVDSSYYFDVTIAPRGAYTYDLTTRKQATNSAVRREYGELFDRGGRLKKDARSTVLFSIFLDSSKILVGKDAVFSMEIAVTNAGYEVDGKLLFDKHIPGEHLFRDTLVLFAKRKPGNGWELRYVWTDESWANGGRKSRAELTETEGKAVGIRQVAPDVFSIPITSKKGFAANLKISLAPWS